MSTEYIASIGLEVHVQLKTRTKMFCSCPAHREDDPPNTNVCPVCLGLPGALPVPNREAIRKTVKTGLMMGSTISLRSRFDRKNYFYPDMPKNYQITQQERPLCIGGGLEIEVGGRKKFIRLNHIHQEEDAAKITHLEHSSEIDYNRASTPLMENVYKTKDAFPNMISSTLDSVAVGTVTKPAFDVMTNTYYTYKLLGKATQPDSVLFRQIGVIGKDEADIAKKADSIMTALSSGAQFKDLAKKYNQTGDSTWIATSQYGNAALDADNTLYINTLYGMNAGENKKLKLENGSTIILQVMKTANPVTKYNVAAVVKELKFSDETYNKEYNKFSSFVAENTTLEQIEANAPKNGYTVRPIEDVTVAAHNIANIRATRDALKWVFDGAKVGNVSQLYECGNNDHLLLVALTGINPAGYRSMDKLKDALTDEIKMEKKVAQIYEKAKNTKSMAEAKKIADVVVDTVKHVSFSAPTFIAATSSSEPLVSAVAAKTAKGAFANAIKGKNGVYFFQVLDKTKTSEKFDEKAEQSSLAMTNFRNASSAIINALYLKANVKDNRYKFF